jgi:polysaccharide pyruvyl transferase WcaK-like protein
MINIKIGVVGLFSNKNIGDYLLVESAKFLLKKQSPDIALKDVDVDPRNPAIWSGRRKINLKIHSIMSHYKNAVFKIIIFPTMRYYYEYFMWWIKIDWLYKEYIKDVDCLVVAGGGFLKFRTQGLSYLDEILINNAKKRNIPVMFNAVGIEGYDSKDIRCSRLKKAINSNVVKVITTRDDVKTLREDYVFNEKIITALVGDPVFWLKDCFSIRRDETSNKIGINLINPNNYIAYGGTTSYFKIENFYKNLLQELSIRDTDFYLFTNGMLVDQKFGRKLLKKMNLPKSRLLHRPSDSPEFLAQVSQFGVILSARMHAGIVAYALDIPKVGLIWSEKIEFLATITGERANYFNEHELDYKKIADLLCDGIGKKVDDKKREELKKKTFKHIQTFLESVTANKEKQI